MPRTSQLESDAGNFLLFDGRVKDTVTKLKCFAGASRSAFLWQGCLSQGRGFHAYGRGFAVALWLVEA